MRRLLILTLFATVTWGPALAAEQGFSSAENNSGIAYPAGHGVRG